ncbi:hypothetical protein F511_02032 [Dorcoceras hygrometricum]|uniref:Uncharacterized protein n=1 Tax=Dorcoceras hygrometricum TaxID=472368 RepID=A0A2Z7AQ04_9LAMI|nr:hypothetical protein F511_02032 [Dorcoceras hygrometricum]
MLAGITRFDYSGIDHVFSYRVEDFRFKFSDIELRNSDIAVDNCQSGPRPEPRLLRQAALEALTRSARTDSPRRTGRKQISGEDRRRSVGGGLFERREAACLML